MTLLYSAAIMTSEMLGNEIMTLTLKKPNGFLYEPGQYSIIPFAGREVYMSLVLHANPSLMRIAFRTGASPLKKYLQSLQANDMLVLQQPDGHFILDDTMQERPIVLLAGGIGITPIRSLVDELARRKQAAPYYLFHSCRSAGEALFADEFAQLSQHASAFTYTPVYTRVTGQGEKSAERITADTLDAVGSLAEADYFIAGPHSFVDSMITLLQSNQVSSDHIRTEVFCGYCGEHECCCDAVSEHLHCAH